MTGTSEILVLILLIACVLILPRFFKKESSAKKSPFSPVDKIKKLSVKARAAILVTLLYPASMALVLRPWESNYNLFLLFGLAPVVIAWSIKWILGGRNLK